MPYVPSLVQVRQERRKVIEKRQRSMVHKYISRRATRPTADVCHGDWLPSLTFHKHPATLFALEQSAPSRGTVSMPSRNGAWLQIMHIGAHCTRLLGAAIATLRSTSCRGDLQGSDCVLRMHGSIGQALGTSIAPNCSSPCRTLWPPPTSFRLPSRELASNPLHAEGRAECPRISSRLHRRRIPCASSLR